MPSVRSAQAATMWRNALTAGGTVRAVEAMAKEVKERQELPSGDGAKLTVELVLVVVTIGL